MTTSTVQHDFSANILFSHVGVDAFQDLIWRHYRDHGRTFLWREQVTPYRVVVSEIMLQQTQTDRVSKKFQAFIDAFPDFSSLRQAPFSEVLGLWKGLGYNRRAMNLQRIATIVVDEFGGILPRDSAVLQTFPGIGKATARSIFTFAFNEPSVFIETNIRSVFLHFFFKDENAKVHDRAIEKLVEKYQDISKPREWYYALMDFGVMLKKTLPNPNHQSAHYKKQSRFIGSDRQLRGKILDFLLKNERASLVHLEENFFDEAERFHRILSRLCDEGLVKISSGLYYL